MGIVGINYPFRTYPDFGHIDDALKQNIISDLDTLNNIGVKAVRWWLMGDGNAYAGWGSDAPTQDINGIWHFNPPTLSPNYVKIKTDFIWVLEELKKRNMQMIPSLFDFYIFRQRGDIINDPIKSDFFINNVFKELLDASIPYKDTIFAWEVMNEPERPIRENWTTVEKMINFIYNCNLFINSYKNTDGTNTFKSTVGWAYAESINTYNTKTTPYLAVTLHQYHYYPWNAYPGNPGLTFYSSLPHPCIIGEYASQHIENPSKYIWNWPELPISNQSVYDKIKLMDSYGYPASFMWSMNNVGDNTGPGEWDQYTIDSIIRYTSHSMTCDFIYRQ